jgi:hypothetical protein
MGASKLSSVNLNQVAGGRQEIARDRMVSMLQGKDIPPGALVNPVNPLGALQNQRQGVPQYRPQKEFYM